MGRKNSMVVEIERELHDLCQPLTTLQCQLELGQMCGDEASLMEAVEGALLETTKVFRGIGLMRERLMHEMGRAVGGAATEED
jgi:hypothetical protein